MENVDTIIANSTIFLLVFRVWVCEHPFPYDCPDAIHFWESLAKI